MKWTPILFIFFYFKSNAQTIDTLTNAKAYASNYIRTPIYGLTTNNHAYTIGFKLSFTGATPNPMDVIRVDLDAHTTSSKTLSYTLSSTSFYWRSVFNSLGEVYLGLNSANRKILKLNMKDSIQDTNLGNCFYSGDNLAYSMLRGRDGNIYIGGSSSSGQSCDFTMINYLNNAVTMYHAVDAQDYVITINGDTNFIYLQTGQGTFDYWSFCKANQRKTRLWTNPIFSNAGATTSGEYIQQPYPLYSRAIDSSLNVEVPTGTSIEYTEFNGTNQSTMLTFYDDVKGKLFWQKNALPIDSMDVPNSYEVSALRRVYADTYNKRFFNYIGDYYGIWYRYDTLNQTSSALGHVGINLFDAMQVAPNKWYMIGYPSSQLLLWDSSLYWSAETFNQPLSATTNPKRIDFGRTTSDVHEPQKLRRTSNGCFWFGGNEIRTGNTVGINWYDSATNTLGGFNGDHFSPRQYSDIAAWGNKMVLSTQSATNHGKLFYFDGTTHALLDSSDDGFKNDGYIFIQGDRLYGIAQDTTNIFQTIDSTIFYIKNLSTGAIVYYRKMVGTVNTAQLMPDGFIGINYTRRLAPDQGLINATLPTDFYPFRRIDNRTYNYNGTNKYYVIGGLSILQYSGITTAPIDINTYQGKYQFLQNLFQ